MQEVHNPDHQSPLDYYFYEQNEATPTSNFTHNHHIRHVTSIDTGTDDTTNQYRAEDNDQVLNSLTDQTLQTRNEPVHKTPY